MFSFFYSKNDTHTVATQAETASDYLNRVHHAENK